MIQKKDDSLTKTRLNRRPEFGPIWYIMPAIIVLVVINFYPLIRAINLSLYNYNLLKPNRIDFIGIKNFVEVIFNPIAWGALKTTAIFTFGGTIIEIIFGLLLALLFNREFWGKGLVRSLIILPMILSPVAVGLVWRIFYDADAGMVNYFFSLIGLPVRAWLGNITTALPALIATDVWQWTSFCFLVLLAALEGMPIEPYEAAKIDGASVFQSFKFITFPLIKPILVIIFALRMIDSIKMFDLVFIMTNGGPGRATETMNFLIYQTGFRFFHIGKASSQAIILTIIVTVVSLLLLRKFIRMRGAES